MKLRHLAVLLASLAPLVSIATPIHNFLDIQPRATAKATTPLDKAYDALNEGKHDQAKQLFSEAAKAEPANPLPLLGLADIARLQHKDVEATDWVKKAYKVAPQSVDALVAMARLSMATKQWKEAERFAQEAAKADPKAVAPQLDLGELYLNVLHKPDLAADAFRKASELKPEHAGARFGLGMALLAKQNPADAVRAMNETVRLAPENPLSHYGLGQAEAARGDYRAATRAYDRAIALDPKFSTAMVAGAEARQASGDLKGAVELVDKAAVVDPKSAQVRFKQGMLHHAAGDAGGAYAGYLAAIKAEPKFALAYNNAAALAASRKERLDDALAWAQKAVVLSPNENTYLDTLAGVHIARGNRAEATKLLEKIAASEHPQADSLYQLGLLRQAAGQNKEAVQAYRRALQIDPAFAGARDANNRIAQLDTKR